MELKEQIIEVEVVNYDRPLYDMQGKLQGYDVKVIEVLATSYRDALEVAKMNGYSIAI